jgi:hypothetical protein
MKRSLLIGIFISGWLVAGCGPIPGGTVPNLEPVARTTGITGTLNTTLTASTNCAKVGELITFTLTLENLRTQPMTLTDTPRLDLVIEPHRAIRNPADVQRWSADPDYPSIDVVLHPREVRQYAWGWHADPRYAATANTYEDGIHVQINNGITLPSGSASGFVMYVDIGVRSIRTPGETTYCKDLTR